MGFRVWIISALLIVLIKFDFILLNGPGNTSLSATFIDQFGALIVFEL